MQLMDPRVPEDGWFPQAAQQMSLHSWPGDRGSLSLARHQTASSPNKHCVGPGSPGMCQAQSPDLEPESGGTLGSQEGPFQSLLLGGPWEEAKSPGKGSLTSPNVCVQATNVQTAGPSDQEGDTDHKPVSAAEQQDPGSEGALRALPGVSSSRHLPLDGACAPQPGPCPCRADPWCPPRARLCRPLADGALKPPSSAAPPGSGREQPSPAPPAAPSGFRG